MNKKLFLLVIQILFLSSVYNAAAQEGGILDIVLSPELNAYGIHADEDGTASVELTYGASIGAAYTVIKRLQFGFRPAFYTDAKEIYNIEIAGYFRGYLIDYDFFSLFAQTSLGAAVFINSKTGEDPAGFLGEFLFGWRLSLDTFFIEPYARLGTPFNWGVGIGVGFKNDVKETYEKYRELKYDKQYNKQLFNRERYFVSVNGKIVGPYSLEELFKLVKLGEVQLYSLVSRDGTSEWDLAENVPAIKQMFIMDAEKDTKE
jgi:hypothetical protein